jgi:hypothetical protein
MRICLFLCSFASLLYSQEPPEWVLKGILAVETRSVLLVNGRIEYVDRSRGAAGERGPFQMRRVAFKQIAQPLDDFDLIEKNPEYARRLASRYLIWLRSRTSSWERAVESYNAGPNNRSPQYLKLVLREGKK